MGHTHASMQDLDAQFDEKEKPFKLNDTDPKHSNGDGYITKEGHTMFNQDIVKELNRIPSLEVDKFHYDSLMDCCSKILDSIDKGNVPQRGIMGLRILINREK